LVERRLRLVRHVRIGCDDRPPGPAARSRDNPVVAAPNRTDRTAGGEARQVDEPRRTGARGRGDASGTGATTGSPSPCDVDRPEWRVDGRRLASRHDRLLVVLALPAEEGVIPRPFAEDAFRELGHAHDPRPAGELPAPGDDTADGVEAQPGLGL